MKIEEIEENLNGHKRKIKFRANKKFNNFKEVIDFATISNYTVDNSTTYPKGGEQCEKGRSRGASDIFRICKFYFPETKLKDVLLYLRDGDFYRSYCYTTRQDVFNKCSPQSKPAYYITSHPNLKVRLRTFKPEIADIEN